MSPKHILTPLYLDQWRDEYDTLANGSWVINRTPHIAGPDVLHRVKPAYRYLTGFVKLAVESSKLPVSWTPDCTAAIPMLAGIQQAGINPILIWFDAHGDFNTWETSESGFIGGMPLAMMTGRGEQTIVKAVGQKMLPDSDVYLTDARDLDSDERRLLAKSDINHFPKVELLTKMTLPDRPIWVHFDSDIMRIDDCPATNYPTRGGPSITEMESAFLKIKKTGNLIGLSVSLWENRMPGNETSRNTIMGLVEKLIG